MADPFLGEIRMFAGNFAPVGWMTCDGQTTSFALPDLRGRAAAHITAGAQPGQQGGSETVTLTVAQLPTHSHTAEAATTGTVRSPAGQVWAADSGQNVAPYAAAPNGHTLAGSAIGPQGGGQPHDNMQPFLAVSFIIAVDGIYPSRP